MKHASSRSRIRELLVKPGGQRVTLALTCRDTFSWPTAALRRRGPICGRREGASRRHGQTHYNRGRQHHGGGESMFLKAVSHGADGGRTAKVAFFNCERPTQYHRTMALRNRALRDHRLQYFLPSFSVLVGPLFVPNQPSSRRRAACYSRKKLIK